MKKPALAVTFIFALLVSTLVLFGALHFGTAQSGTNVTGIIYSDTTWTQANSPYNFTGPVAVNANATLTIQAGVTVNIGTYYLQVNGGLNAVGSQTNLIHINGSGDDDVIVFASMSNGWNPQTKSGSIIENAIMNYNTSFGMDFISIDNASPKINNDTINCGEFDTAVSVNYGAPIISNCSINGNGGIGSIGIKLSDTNSSIYDNTIYATDSGIFCLDDNSTVVGNLIINSIDTGLYAGIGPALIENNTIVENNVGVQLILGSNGVQSNALLFNNIQNNIEYNFQYQDSSNFNAAYNWWGTTDAASISQTIYDFKYNFNEGNVTFVPFLNAPNTDAPTYVSANSGVGGSIVPSGAVSVNYGGSQSFTITPNTGYSILDVTINGTSIGAVSTYNIQNISGATKVTATFAPNSTPTPSPTLTLSPSPSPTTSPTLSQTPTSSHTDTPHPTSTPTHAPTATPNSTPTSTPTTPSTYSPTPTVQEFPTLTILPLFALTILLSIVIIQKRIPKK